MQQHWLNKLSSIAALLAGGCGRKCSPETELQASPPDVFMLQLGWENMHESSARINATTACISEVRLQLLPACGL